MKFDFFTFGGRFFWEDILNYQNWVIQRKIDTKIYRLLDSNDVERESGNFDICKNTLLKYIEACELPEPKKDSIILIPNYARSKESLRPLAESLKDLDANIIIFNYPSLRKGIRHNSDILEQFINNLSSRGKLNFITNGAGCLVLRKLLAGCNNFRKFNIESVLDINPINSGSSLAELFSRKTFFRQLLGPMIKDMIPKKVSLISTLPKEISHGIIFIQSNLIQNIRNILTKLDGFPPITPPDENSYAGIVKHLNSNTAQPLSSPTLAEMCRQFILHNNFELPENTDSNNSIK